MASASDGTPAVTASEKTPKLWEEEGVAEENPKRMRLGKAMPCQLCGRSAAEASASASQLLDLGFGSRLHSECDSSGNRSR